MNNEPTRYSASSSTCIDIFTTNSPDLIKEIETHPLVVGDHCFPRTLQQTPYSKQKRRKLLYYEGKRNDGRIREELAGVRWSEEIKDCNSDEAARVWKHTPHKFVWIRDCEPDWCNESVQDLANKQKKKYRKFKDNGTLKAKREWDEACSRYVRVIQQARIDYEKKLCEEINNGQLINQ